VNFNIDGHEVLFDDEDLILLFNFKWRVWKRGHTHYVESGSQVIGGYRTNGMHNLILGRREGFFVDHINGSGLDNRKRNLRFATESQNQFNQRNRANKKYKGTYFVKEKKLRPWNAKIQANKKTKNLGYFATEIEAAAAYNKAAEFLHGAFAKLNILNKENI
jgi:hypothetical protein